MKIGDLIEVTTCSNYFGQIGIVTEFVPATIIKPYEVISVIFSNAERLCDIPSRWVEVVNESR